MIQNGAEGNQIDAILSDNLWKFALEGVGDSLWEWSLSEKRLAISSSWKESLGYSSEDIGETLEEWEKLIHPDDLPACRADFSRYLRGETPMYRNEHRIRAKNGQYRWFLDRGIAFTWDEQGVPLRIVGIYTEITDKKQIEQKLTNQETHYLSVINTIIDGIVVINHRGVIQSVNPSTEKMFGYAAHELIGQNVSLLMSDPERSHHDSYLNRYVETRVAHIIGYGREVTGLRKDGVSFPIDLAVSEMLIEGERYFTGILRDITKRKRSEVALQMATSFYTDKPMLITDADNCIITVNKPFTETTGYDLHEVLGKNPSCLSSGKHDAHFYEQMWDALRKTGHWQGTIWNRRKNGTLYLESLAISLIYSDDGEVSRYVAVFSEVAI